MGPGALDKGSLRGQAALNSGQRGYRRMYSYPLWVSLLGPGFPPPGLFKPLAMKYDPRSLSLAFSWLTQAYLLPRIENGRMGHLRASFGHSGSAAKLR